MPKAPNAAAPEQAKPTSVMTPELAARVRLLGVDPSDPRDVARAMKRAEQLRAVVARNDPSAFCAYVLRDEKSGKPIIQAPMHKVWHQLMTEHERLIMWSHVEGGKTNQVAVGRVLFELGHDPNLRVAVVSNTSDLAQKMTRALGQYIEKSRPLHDVFPNLVPTTDPSLPWKAKALTVQRAGVGGKDPSVQACGVHGNIIGSRVDLLVLDDVLDHENTNTPSPRMDVLNWIKSSLFSRLTDNARVWIVGNAWHPEDAMHMLEKEPRFYAQRFPVILPDGTTTWPDRWPRRRIESAKADLGPLEFARQLMCQARDDTSARFKREWIDTCIDLGRGYPFVTSLRELFEQDAYTEEEVEEAMLAEDSIIRLGGAPRIVTGVDLAVQRHASADDTVLFTILVQHDGRRRVLSIRSGKWSGPEIINEVEKCYRDFGGVFVVENNAAQQYLVDFLQQRSSNVPIIPFTTGRNKADPAFGVESLAAELSAGRWLIPNERGVPMQDDVQKWITELLFYDPKEHTGDRVMASWFAREGARRFLDGGNSSGVGVRTF